MGDAKAGRGTDAAGERAPDEGCARQSKYYAGGETVNEYSCEHRMSLGHTRVTQEIRTE